MESTTVTTRARSPFLGRSLPFAATASMSALVLTPVAVLAGMLGAWRVSADLGWTNGFFIADGLLSRYQVWFAIAVSAQASSVMLSRWVADNDAKERSAHMAQTVFSAAHASIAATSLPTAKEL